MVAPARSIFSFDSWDRDHPGERPPGDRLDAQFAELLRGQALILEQLDAVARSQQAVEALARNPIPLTAAPNALGYAAGGFYATDAPGAAATSADYAQVSIEWSEHMPDTIPPNTLAINAITGDHWSSRWWANKAALLWQGIIAAGLSTSRAVVAEQMTVTGVNTLAPLSQIPLDAATTMQVIVNGRVFSGCVSPASFTVSGFNVVWASPYLSISPGDEVVARYTFNSTLTLGPPAVAKFPAISLYYLATTGQTGFVLSAPDRFALTYMLKPSSKVQVARNGVRLMPDDGSGKGSYAVAGNTITLLYPAGQDETIIIDVWESV